MPRTLQLPGGKDGNEGDPERGTGGEAGGKRWVSASLPG